MSCPPRTPLTTIPPAPTTFDFLKSNTNTYKHPAASGLCVHKRIAKGDRVVQRAAHKPDQVQWPVKVTRLRLSALHHCLNRRISSGEAVEANGPMLPRGAHLASKFSSLISDDDARCADMASFSAPLVQSLCLVLKSTELILADLRKTDRDE